MHTISNMHLLLLSIIHFIYYYKSNNLRLRSSAHPYFRLDNDKICFVFLEIYPFPFAVICWMRFKSNKILSEYLSIQRASIILLVTRCLSIIYYYKSHCRWLILVSLMRKGFQTILIFCLALAWHKGTARRVRCTGWMRLSSTGSGELGKSHYAISARKDLHFITYGQWGITVNNKFR